MTLPDSLDAQHIEDLLAAGDMAAADELRPLRPADQAELLLGAPDASELAVLAHLSPSEVSPILEYLASEGPAALEPLAGLPTETLTRVLTLTPMGIAARVLRAFPEERRAEVLTTLSPRERGVVETLVAQNEETAGALVTTDFIALRAEMTVRQATAAIRSSATLASAVEQLFIVDANDRLTGNVSFRALLIATPDMPLHRIMEADPLSVPAGTDQEECARLMQRYHLDVLPIVDHDGTLLGFMDLPDVLDVAETEATEDMYMIVGLSAGESVSSGLGQSIRRRLPWLALNLATAFAAASVVGLFESTIARAAIVAAFLPIVGGQGGNAIIQTVTIIVRSIALGDLTFHNARQVLIKETLLGGIHGVVIGVVAAVAGFMWSGDAWIGAALGLAMIVNMVAAGAAGVLIPLGLRKVGVDPALAAGIFGTTVTDVIGFAVLLLLVAASLNAVGL